MAQILLSCFSVKSFTLIIVPEFKIATSLTSKHFLSSRFNFRTFRWMQTMIFAIEEINRNGKLLPNITLGYKIYDSCSTPHQALRAAMQLMRSDKGSGVEGEMQSKDTCHKTVPAVIGDGGSTQSLVVARFLGVFHVPQVR